MAVTTDKHQLQLEIVNEAQTELGNMEKELNRLEKSLKGLKKDSEEYIATTKQIDQAKQQLGNFRKEMDLNKMSYQQLIKYQKDLQKEARAAFGTERFKQLQPELDRVNAKVKETNTEIRGVSQASEGMFQRLIQMTPFAGHFNNLKGSIAGVQAATGGASKGFKLLRAALISTGIGAIVVLLGSLVAWLTTTQAGIDKVTAVTRPLQVIFQRLLGVLQNLGGKIFKQFTAALKDPVGALKNLGKMIMENLENRLKAIPLAIQAIRKVFSKDWKEGFKDLADAAIQGSTGVTDGLDKINKAVAGTSEFIKESIEQGTQLDLLTKRIEQAEINLINNRDRMLAQIKQLNDVVEDQAASEEERKKAAEEALALQDRLMKMDKEVIDLKIERMELEHTFNDTSRADEKELAELRAEGFRKEMEITEMRTTMRNKLNIIDKQIADEEKKRIEEATKRRIEAEKALQALRIEAMEEGLEKEIAKINQEYDEKLKTITGNEQQITEQRKLIEQQRAKEIAEARRMEEENIRLEDEEIQKTLLEQKFLNALIKEEEFQEAMYELEREAMTRRLELIKMQHGEESLEYARQYTAILRLDKDYNDQKIENAKKAEEFKKRIEESSLDASRDFINTGIDLLSQDEEARRKNAGVIKAFETAKVTTDGIREVAAIWKHAAELGPIAGPIVGAIRTAAAVARTTLAVNKINTTKFDRGGIFKGPRHRQGGSAVIDSVTGQKIAEVEAGEPYMILSRNTYANNRRIVDQLLYSSMYQDGAPIFETGGVMNPYRTGAAAQTATPAPGLPASAGANANQTAADQTPAAANISADLLVRLINEVIALRRDLLAGEIQAKVVHSQLEKVEAEINTIRNDAALRR